MQTVLDSLYAMGSFLETGDKVASIIGAAGVLSLVVAIVAFRRQTAPTDRESSDRVTRGRPDLNVVVDYFLLLVAVVVGASGLLIARWEGDDDTWDDGGAVVYPLATGICVLSIFMIPFAHRVVGVRWGVAAAMSFVLLISGIAMLVLQAFA